ncbi:MAG: BamA/TamA family outer membrane protein [bacterium]|nr:BamA/TamA family outer membrane protein [bacterium]
MRRALLFLSLLLVVDVASAHGSLPRVIGGTDLDPRYVAGLLAADSSFEFARTRTLLEDSLIALGYFAARVGSLSSDSLVYAKGERYTISQPRWLGDSAVVAASVFERLPLRAGERFEFWQVQESAQHILAWCDEHGRPFAALQTDSLEIDDHEASIRPHFLLQAGPEILISFVEFTGNAVSQPRLLLRESRLKLGEPFRASRVAQAGRRLRQLEYVRRVDEPRIVIDEQGKSGLLVNIEESRLSRVDAVAGLAPAPEGEAQTVTGLVDLQVMNLFGTGRRGKVFWQRPSRDIQELALAWREPWILGTPLRSDLTFAQRVEDTLFVTRKFGIRVAYPVSASVELFAGVSGEELLADSATSGQLGVVPTQTTLVESGFVVDTRDHLSNPRSGVRFESAAATGRRRADRAPVYSSRTKFTQQRALVDAELYRELFMDWILAFAAHARGTFSDEPEIPAADLYKVGGARTMRGYREEQFAGSQTGWGTVEARYWLGTASRFALFTDIGVIARESRIDAASVRPLSDERPMDSGYGSKRVGGFGE